MATTGRCVTSSKCDRELQTQGRQLELHFEVCARTVWSVNRGTVTVEPALLACSLSGLVAPCLEIELFTRSGGVATEAIIS